MVSHFMWIGSFDGLGGSPAASASGRIFGYSLSRNIQMLTLLASVFGQTDAELISTPYATSVCQQFGSTLT